MKKKSTPALRDDVASKTLAKLCRDVMPYINARKNPICCIENIKILLDILHVRVSYDVIRKKINVVIPDETFSIDNEEEVANAWILSHIKQIEMASDNYDRFIAYIADKNQFNPVQQWIESKKWDGRTRLKDLYDTIKSTNEEAKEAFIFRWLIGAVAAACSPTGVDSTGVLVLQGAQDLGKTWWFRKLVPYDQLPDVIRADANINPHDRDSVNQAICNWLVELGELDATFSKADTAALKSFITREFDIIRRPYARKDSKFPRRTAFMASVNPKEYLNDETGNRRFWTIQCLSVDSYHEIDMQQLWAEVYHKWRKGASWRMEKKEKEMLKEINEQHITIDPITAAVHLKYEWEDKNKEKWKKKSASEVLEQLGIQRAGKREARLVSHALREMSGEPSRHGKGFVYDVPPLRPIYSHGENDEFTDRVGTQANAGNTKRA